MPQTSRQLWDRPQVDIIYRNAAQHEQYVSLGYNDLIVVYRISHGLVNENVKISTSTISTRGHRFKLQTSQFNRYVAKNPFCNRVATDTIDHFKKALCTAHFEAALTFNNRHSSLALSALHLCFYSYVFSTDFASHYCGRL